ncbi:hypothetical protein [Arthrobacter sp. Z4-13]
MDLEVFVQEARLWNRDPGPQSDALIRRLRAENGETIIDLYEQALRSASQVFLEWESRPEPKALFEAKMAAAESGPFDPQKFDPTAPPMLGRQPDEREPYSYEQWLRGWCLYQVLVGNVPTPEGHFLEHPDRPAMFDFFMGMIGNGMHADFRDAYERSTDTLWPLAPREDEPRFLEYGEQLEHAPYRVQLYRATAREVTMDLNASAAWRQWWLSGPLRSLEFSISESHSWFPGAAAMHTGDTPTTTRIRKVGLTVRGTITPNLDRILETEEQDMRRLVIQDLTALLLKVHKKYGFTAELPKAE